VVSWPLPQAPTVFHGGIEKEAAAAEAAAEEEATVAVSDLVSE
jgi:hypothetical protein